MIHFRKIVSILTGPLVPGRFLELLPTAAAIAVLVFIVQVDSATLASPKQTASGEPSQHPLILAHYMPWYAAKPIRAQWGWHWTMNHFNPDKQVDGKREVASEYYPLIGAYDSGDPVILECHLLQMKLAGIDGVIVDWYGLEDFRDYAMLHKNTQQLIKQATRLNLRFVICYEDQTIPALVAGNRLSADEAAKHAATEIRWLKKHWFALDGYVRLRDDPVLLSFGLAGLRDREWTQCLESLDFRLAYFSQQMRRKGAVGGFDWPLPDRGLSQLERFAAQSSAWPYAIPVVFPRFVDVYERAKVREGFPRIADEQGRVMRATLKAALASKTPIIQVATWNDWGEGTQIEPSREFGYRDLELLQNSRRRRDKQFEPVPADLRLPIRLLQLRRTKMAAKEKLDSIAEFIRDGRLDLARQTLTRLEGVAP